MTRRTAIVLSCVGLIAMWGAPQSAGADDPESWAGQKVMMKKAGVKIGHTDDKGQQVYVATVNNMVVTVLKENGDWIRVRQQGAEGWLVKEDAVLLKDAIGLFTSRLEKNPNDAFAYAHRGWAYKEKGELASAIKDMSEAIRLNPKEA